MANVLLSMLALLFACLLLIAYYKIRGSGSKFTFVYSWGGIFGAFVWEDVFIFSAFWMGTALATLITRDLRIGLLLLTVFWVVRSSGETLYFMLQQFLVPTHTPHDVERHFAPLRTIFGDINGQKGFIIMQVMFQVIGIIAISCLILLVTHWQSLPVWFN